MRSGKSKVLIVDDVPSKAEDIDEIEGFNIGAADYIRKPFSPAIVKARVKNHIEFKRMRDQLEEIIKDRTDELLNILRKKRDPE